MLKTWLKRIPSLTGPWANFAARPTGMVLVRSGEGDRRLFEPGLNTSFERLYALTWTFWTILRSPSLTSFNDSLILRHDVVTTYGRRM